MTKLWRPVGQKELDLIEAADCKSFPPRLSWQPIFYPVLSFEYAAKIASEWNTVDSASGYVGYVTEFEIPTEYFDTFKVHAVGGRACEELWVFSENLEKFNSMIVGQIKVVASYFGKDYRATPPNL